MGIVFHVFYVGLFENTIIKMQIESLSILVLSDGETTIITPNVLSNFMLEYMYSICVRVNYIFK